MNALRRLRDIFPITPLGFLCAGLGGGASWYGLRHLDLVLLVCGAVMLAVSGICILAVIASALLARPGLRQKGADAAALSCDCGVRVRTGFPSPRWFRYLPMLELDTAWIEPALVETSVGPAGEEIVARGRDATDLVRRRCVVSDCFGLAWVAFRADESRRVLIRPHPGKLGAPPVLRTFAPGDDLPHPRGAFEGDRADVRAYVHGDSLRHLLWKTYARSGELMVRTPERSISPARRTLVYLCSGRGDEPAAAAARVAVESGSLGDDWALGADGTPGMVSTLAAAELAICSSVRAKIAADQLEAFLGVADRTPGARVLIFVPGRPGPWLDRAERLLRKRGQQLHTEVLIGVDALTHGAAPALWRRILFRSSVPVAPPAAELEVVMSRLYRAGVSPLVLDRLSGRAFRRPPRKAADKEKLAA